MNKKYLVSAVVIAILLVGGGAVWKNTRPPKTMYRSEKVKRGDIGVSILATGTVAPENRLDIKPPVAGRVETVLVKEGQYVKKGDIVAWMSSTERAALLDAAHAKGPDEVKRWEDLYRPTPVMAPIGGTIILRNVESGQTFTATDAILTMSDRLTVQAQVDETDLAQIRLRQTANIVLDAYPDQRFSAKVDRIAFDAKTVNNVTTYIVDVLPDKTPAFMRSGMTANVTFSVENKEGVLVVPNDAVKVQNGKPTVLVQNSDGKPVSREFEAGLSDGRRTEVVSGLDEGMTVLSVQVDFSSKSAASNPLSPMGNRPRPKGH